MDLDSIENLEKANNELRQIQGLLVIDIMNSLNSGNKKSLDETLKADEEAVKMLLDSTIEEENYLEGLKANKENAHAVYYLNNCLSHVQFEKDSLHEMLNALSRMKINGNYDNLISVSTLIFQIRILKNIRDFRTFLNNQLAELHSAGITITDVKEGNRLLHPTHLLDDRMYDVKSDIQKKLKMILK